MPKVSATLTGTEAAKRKAGNIPRAVKNRVRSAVGKIVREVAKDAKAEARKRTGLLGKSMGSVVKTYPNETIVGLAGPRKGFKVTLALQAMDKRGKNKLVGERLRGKAVKLRNVIASTTRKGDRKRIDPTTYAHLVEGGHKKGKGKSTAPAYPFLGPAAKKANAKAKGQIVTESFAGIREA